MPHAQLKQLAHVIRGSRHAFYDPLTRELRPAFAQFISSLHTELRHIDYRDEPSAYWLEQAVIRFFGAPDDIGTMDYLSLEALAVKRTYALSYGYYMDSVREKVARLHGNLLLAENGRFACAYEEVSFIYALGRTPLASMVRQFEDGASRGRGASDGASRGRGASYRSMPGIKIIEQLIAFAKVAHQFEDMQDDSMQGLPNAVAILNERVAGNSLETQRLKPVLKKVKQVVSDHILFYIIEHITQKSFREIPVQKFDNDVVKKYFTALRRTIAAADDAFSARQRQKIIHEIDSNLFEYLPPSPLRFYTPKYKALLAERGMRCFHHAEIIEKIALFIDHIFSSAQIRALYMALLLTAVWDDKALHQNFSQVHIDMKDLRNEIVLLDQGVPATIGNERLFDELLKGFEFADSVRKKMLGDAGEIIDTRFLEMIYIFQGISRQMVACLYQVLRDKTIARKKAVKNWLDVERACPRIERKIIHAISVLKNCNGMVDAMRAVPIER